MFLINHGRQDSFWDFLGLAGYMWFPEVEKQNILNGQVPNTPTLDWLTDWPNKCFMYVTEYCWIKILWLPLYYIQMCWKQKAIGSWERLLCTCILAKTAKMSHFRDVWLCKWLDNYFSGYYLSCRTSHNVERTGLFCCLTRYNSKMFSW